jgi:ATP-dependent 26S proteasome regulatory subunit
VGALLNLGDGLLSDALHIQIVVSFNCSLNEIDPAILRAGRLVENLDFRKLTLEEANILRNKNNLTPLTENKSYSLADIFYT